MKGERESVTETTRSHQQEQHIVLFFFVKSHQGFGFMMVKEHISWSSTFMTAPLLANSLA